MKTNSLHPQQKIQRLVQLRPNDSVEQQPEASSGEDTKKLNPQANVTLGVKKKKPAVLQRAT